MGLLTSYIDDADRLARQDKSMVRNYMHGARAIKSQAAPHEAVVKDYNAQVKGFQNSAVPVADGSSEPWQVISGWISGDGNHLVALSSSTPAGDASGLLVGTVDPDGITTSEATTLYRNRGGKTIRSIADGQPAIGRAGLKGDFYATRDDQPFVPHPTESQTEVAKAADSRIRELSAQGSAMRSEFNAGRDALASKGARIESDIAMNKGALAPQESGESVFDQTKVFQSITDWLKG